MQHDDGPVALILSRQSLPVLDRTRLASAEGLERGAYVLCDAEDEQPQAIIIATGSEVHVALGAQELLKAQGIRARVVSMPCWEAFEAQDAEYRESVLPASVTARVAVEAGAAFGWRRWVGDHGAVVGIDRYGASSPGKINMEEFGFTPQNVARNVRELLSRGTKV